jgi:hypothetical protein
MAVGELAAMLSEWPGSVHLQRFGSEELGAKRLPLKATPSFAGKLRPLALQAAQWAKEGKSVVIASQQALRLDELMQAEGIHPTLTRTIPDRPEPGDIVLLPVAITGGFTVDDAVPVSDAEVFGFRCGARRGHGRASRPTSSPHSKWAITSSTPTTASRDMAD